MLKLKGVYLLGFFAIFISVNLYCQSKTQPYDYQIDLRFDSTNFSFSGDLTLSWLNESLKVVNEFPFLFYMDKSNPAIYDATIDNNSCKIKYTTKEVDGFKGFILKTDKTILPNTKAIIKIKFKTSDDSYNRHKLLIESYTWLPMLQFFENGIFYLHNQKHSNYKVIISYPSDFVFVTSGLVVSESIDKGYTSIVTQAKEIPSFGIVASQFLKYYELTTKNGILVRSYYFDGDSLWGKKFLLYAQKTLDFYCDKFGFYPQPVLNIIPSKDEVGSGHPIDSNILLLYRDNDKVSFKNIDRDDQAKQVIAHEIGHEYWGYNYILENNYDPGTLGISLGLYTDWLYCSAMGLDKQLHNYFFNEYLNGVKAGYNTTIIQPVDSIIKQNIPWNSIIEHGKKFVILRMLAKEIGEEKFFRILEYCLQNYKGINFNLDLFQNACEKITNKDLGWFFDQWYRTNGYLDYQIQTVETNLKNHKYETTCLINRQGSAYMTNLDISIRMKDSTDILKRIDGRQKEIKLIFESESEPARIEIDPQNELPLVNRKIWIKYGELK